MDKGIKILIADDSAFMRKFLGKILQDAGFSNFIEATNGKEAVEKYYAEKPGIVLLDFVMEVMDGLDVLREIGKEAKVIMISAVGQEILMNEAFKFGALNYIVKPFNPKEVTDKIIKALS